MDSEAGALRYLPNAKTDVIDRFLYQVCDTGQDGDATTGADIFAPVPQWLSRFSHLLSH